MVLVDLLKFIAQIVMNPMALIGIALGGYVMYNKDTVYIQYIIANPELYAAHILGIAWAFTLLYAVLFNRVYKIDGKKIDWWGTFTSSFWHLFVVISMACVTCAIYWAVSFHWGTNIDRYARNQRVQDDFTPLQIYNRN